MCAEIGCDLGLNRGEIGSRNQAAVCAENEFEVCCNQCDGEYEYLHQYQCFIHISINVNINMSISTTVSVTISSSSNMVV